MYLHIHIWMHAANVCDTVLFFKGISISTIYSI